MSTYPDEFKQLEEQIEQLRSENEEKQLLIDRLCSQEACPKCGYGVTGACYDCEIKRLQAENADLHKETKDEIKWFQASIADLHKEYQSIAGELDKALAELDKYRWIPTDDPPDNIKWDKKVLVLEYESEIPITMTMAEIFLDEGSEAEYWKPIILPEEDK